MCAHYPTSVGGIGTLPSDIPVGGAGNIIIPTPKVPTHGPLGGCSMVRMWHGPNSHGERGGGVGRRGVVTGSSADVSCVPVARGTVGMA